jgi:hypothetical protein
MLTTLRQRTVARALFDEYHGEAWSIRAGVAAAMHPEHPAAASYVAAADALAERDFEVIANTDGPLRDAALAGVDTLVIAHPSEARWERTVEGRPPVFSADEIAAVERFVSGGGGLVVLGEAEEEKFGGNLNELLAPFGVRLQNAVARDYERAVDGATPEWITGELSAQTGEPSLLHLARPLRLYRSGTLAVDDPSAIVVQTSDHAQPPAAGLLAARAHGRGRVVVAASSGLFGDDSFADPARRQLWFNLLYWVSLAAFQAESRPIISEAAQDPAWSRLKDATNALRRLQLPTGEIDRERADLAAVGRYVATMVESIGALAPRFPHEREYLERVPADLLAWVAGGCAKPDFSASLALFRPEQHRRDGIENLVVFPMYTPNGSPDSRFEALIVRTPWPEFIARLERETYHNEKFVPVQLIDYTDGYAGECAVLFPETVSVVGRPTNYFGGIFCDRESIRFRRTLTTAAEALKINLPPEAVALTSSADLALDTYILWDLIHDSWHSHGDLPFDPFMIRQRLPYWMYSLEELRVDLSAYVDSRRLAREGFPFARYVPYAMLFDRVLRFPITGNRVRNYDGLGGQLLFGYLHKEDVVRWTDNSLIVDWERVDAAVADLRERIEVLYKEGIDLSKVSYWAAAHDLVSESVRPNVGSRWQKEGREYSDENDPRAWVDRVLNDEFPLTMFYESLKKKLLDEPAAPQAAAQPAESAPAKGRGKAAAPAGRAASAA